MREDNLAFVGRDSGPDRRGSRWKSCIYGGSDNGQKVVRLETGPAHQGAVHVRLAHKPRGIVRLHAAAVLNRKRMGRNLAKFFGNPAAQEGVYFLGLVRSRVFSRANGPAR